MHGISMLMVPSRRCAASLMSLAVVGLSLAAGGCGSGEPSPVPVEGVVTIDGKAEWPEGGTIFFYPLRAEAGAPSIPGSADFDQQGRFVAQTHKPDDGLYPGEYSVQFRVWKKRPTMQDPAGVSLLPDRYRKHDTSGVTVTVPADGGIRDMTIPVESK